MTRLTLAGDTGEAERTRVRADNRAIAKKFHAKGWSAVVSVVAAPEQTLTARG